MELILTEDGRAELDAAAAGERRLRLWRRDRAVRLLGDGLQPAAVAAALGCSPSSVYNWAAMWRDGGLPGLLGRGHGGGRAPALGAAGERLLEELLGQDPQARGHRATGWTVSLLVGEPGEAGYAVGDRTVRRALHRLGWRWKRPRFVLGRPDPACEPRNGRERAQRGGLDSNSSVTTVGVDRPSLSGPARLTRPPASARRRTPRASRAATPAASRARGGPASGAPPGALAG